MSDFAIDSLRLLVLFSRNAFGSLNNPYTTYRKLAHDGIDARQTVFIILLTILYFVFTALVRTGIRNPYVLTFKFNILVLTATVGFLGMLILLYYLGKIAGGTVSFKTLYILWSFTLLPTIVWFFTTSILFILIPPPRTLSMLGKAYSIFFISFSGAVLIWKLILYYLTLRFGFRFTLAKISLVSSVIAPAVVAYSLITYSLGIFRIPFL